MTTAAPDDQCTIEIDTTLPVENVSWYDIWAAAVAINGICIRSGKTGKATDLGELRLFNDIDVYGIDKSVQAKMVPSSSKCGALIWHPECLFLREI